MTPTTFLSRLTWQIDLFAIPAECHQNTLLPSLPQRNPQSMKILPSTIYIARTRTDRHAREQSTPNIYEKSIPLIRALIQTDLKFLDASNCRARLCRQVLWYGRVVRDRGRRYPSVVRPPTRPLIRAVHSLPSTSRIINPFLPAYLSIWMVCSLI